VVTEAYPSFGLSYPSGCDEIPSSFLLDYSWEAGKQTSFKVVVFSAEQGVAAWLDCRPILDWLKGQLISKCLFGVFNSSKKNEWKIQLNYYDTGGSWYLRFIALSLDSLLLCNVSPRPAFRPSQGRAWRCAYLQRHAHRQKQGLAARSFKEGLFYIRSMAQPKILL
jgi:hypothetical protein